MMVAVTGSKQPLQMSEPSSITVGQESQSSSMGKFGWQEVFDMPIPFIKRNDQNYMLTSIVEQAVRKKFAAYFSDELASCVKTTKHKLTLNEANLFNEINMEHCDCMFSQSLYTTSDDMVDVSDVVQLEHFLKVCYRIIFEKHTTNDLFGFIRIDGANSVPFVWSDSRKLVPVFYFEGEEQFLSNRAIALTDSWKMVYLRFCCKIQKIKADYYNVDSIKVVDFEDVCILFPPNTNFEIHWPEQINEDILARKSTNDTVRNATTPAAPIRIQGVTQESNWLSLAVQVIQHPVALGFAPNVYDMKDVLILGHKFTSIGFAPYVRSQWLLSVNELQKKLSPSRTLQEFIKVTKNNFKTFFVLNTSQKCKWQSVVQNSTYGHYNDLFVAFKEVSDIENAFISMRN